MIKIYCIFDDYSKEAANTLLSLSHTGIDLDVLPTGMQRPTGQSLKKIIEDYDVIIIGTSSVIDESMFENVFSSKIIATASIGIDHIHVPLSKKDLVTIINSNTANRLSVAEYVFGSIIALNKNFLECRTISANNQNKKLLTYKPHDIYGHTLGIIGTGGIGKSVMQLAKAFSVDILAYSDDPIDVKQSIENDYGCKYVSMRDLLSKSDYVLCSLPLTPSTKSFISYGELELMKPSSTFISISHSGVVDVKAVTEKAKNTSSFLVGMDMDSENNGDDWKDLNNVLITPHVAGGTVEARERMFYEVACRIVDFIKQRDFKDEQR